MEQYILALHGSQTTARMCLSHSGKVTTNAFFIKHGQGIFTCSYREWRVSSTEQFADEVVAIMHRYCDIGRKQ